MNERWLEMESKLRDAPKDFMRGVSVVVDIDQLPDSLPGCSAADWEREREQWAEHVQDLRRLLRTPVKSVAAYEYEFSRITAAMLAQLASTRRLAGFDWNELARDLRANGIILERGVE